MNEINICYGCSSSGKCGTLLFSFVSLLWKNAFLFFVAINKRETFISAVWFVARVPSIKQITYFFTLGSIKPLMLI